MIVVIGATGNVGRALVRRLDDAGRQVTAVARRIRPSDVPHGVNAVAADLADIDSLGAAFAGADALFLLVAGDDPLRIVGRAKQAGVRRIVLLSTQGVGTRPAAYAHAAAFERAVADSGLEYRVLRSGGMASNAFAWAEPIRTRRVAAAPFADVGLPFIDPEDVAAAAAESLIAAQVSGATYVLTGPAATTPRERAGLIGEAIGEEVTFVEQTRDEAHAQLSAFMPAAVVEGTLAILGEPTADEQQVSPDLERLLGRPGTSFGTWAVRNAAAFR